MGRTSKKVPLWHGVLLEVFGVLAPRIRHIARRDAHGQEGVGAVPWPASLTPLPGATQP